MQRTFEKANKFANNLSSISAVKLYGFSLVLSPAYKTERFRKANNTVMVANLVARKKMKFFACQKAWY